MHKNPDTTTYAYKGTVAGRNISGQLEVPALDNLAVTPRIRGAAMRRHVFGVARKRFGVKLDACERSNNIRFRRA